MPPNHKVSVGWQVVAQFIPVVDLWSAYRIRKLRKFVLYVYLPYIVNSAVYLYYYFSDKRFARWGDDGLAFGDPTTLAIEIATTAISLIILGLAIYLIIKWSREHNRKFDTPA